MGNNTSVSANTSTRKSAAAILHQQNLDLESQVSVAGSRKSSSGRNATAKGDTSLDEDFSDLILHQVKRQDLTSSSGYLPTTNILAGGIIPVSSNIGSTPAVTNTNANANLAHNTNADPYYSATYNQFSNDLIEDEFNELNDGLLDQEPEVSRNILPDDASEITTESTNSGANDETQDNMDVDEDHFKAVTDQSNTDSDLDMNHASGLSKVDFTKVTPANQQPHEVSVKVDNSYVHQSRKRHNRSGNASASNVTSNLIPVEIKWVNSSREVINKISIIGSFTNWRDSIPLSLSPFHSNEYVTTLNLPLGVHKLLYIINNEYRVSDQLPTATDLEGIFFNWFEVIDEAHLFNHSLNQPNHIGASTDYDANIISPPYYDYKTTSSFSVNHQVQPQTAGKFEVDQINRKSNSFLAKISKENSSNFEHVEYAEDKNDDMKDIRMHEEEQKSSENYPYGSNKGSVPGSTQYVPYSMSSSTSLRTPTTENVPKLEYSSDIPEMFQNYDYFKNKSPNYELPEPPQLPAHLNNVLLNKMSQTSSQSSQSHISNSQTAHSSSYGSTHHQSLKPPNAAFVSESSPTNQSHNKRPTLRRADSSYYASNKESYHQSIPNHVILNHLMTTSIRNDVLTVACITRYSGKFVTQIMHSPADK